MSQKQQKLNGIWELNQEHVRPLWTEFLKFNNWQPLDRVASYCNQVTSPRSNSQIHCNPSHEFSYMCTYVCIFFRERNLVNLFYKLHGVTEVNFKLKKKGMKWGDFSYSLQSHSNKKKPKNCSNGTKWKSQDPPLYLWELARIKEVR